MYNIDEIKELIALLEQSQLSVIELQKEDGSKVRLEKPSQQCVTIPTAVQAPVVQASATPVSAPAVEQTENLMTINSPIVGVFYAAPAPGKDPFTAVGKSVKKGDTVCIVEAMKCMNEIQAEEDGTIVEVLVKDGELVEYGQPLFRLS